MDGKVGLVTFHETDNYGTCLQAFALQRTIELMGYNVSIINFQRDNNLSHNSPSVLDRVRYVLKEYGCKNILMRSKAEKFMDNRMRIFQSFRDQNFHYSDTKFHKFNDLLVLNNQFDAFVCGSDMIWTYDRAQDLNVYFLLFADSRKRIAYSPSIGSTGIPQELEKDYKEMLSGMAYLSCRERSGVKEIERVSGLKAVWTLDPTLILDKKEWNIISKNRIINKQREKYILVYLFEGIPNWAYKTIIQESEKRKARIVEIPMSVKQICNAVREGSNAIGPIEFISLVRNSECVFTNSYHGLMFSLIFEKDFYIISRNADGHWVQFENRLTDLLNEIDCLNRVLSPNMNCKNTSIDYRKVSDILDKFRKESNDYLEKALSYVCRN